MKILPTFERSNIMSKKIKTIFNVSFVFIFGLGLISSRAEAGHLVLKGGTIHLEAPPGEEVWTGVVTKQILGEKSERVGTIAAEIINQEEVGNVYLQTVYLTEKYDQGTISHLSKATVTPTRKPLIYNVQALTTVTEGTGQFEGATGIWSVRGILDLRCLGGLKDVPENRIIDLEIEGGFVEGPKIP
jgi:hypothetical protein